MPRSKKPPWARKGPVAARAAAARGRPTGPASPQGSHGERELQRLLAECRLTFYRASGPGGQHRNKTETAVRLNHLPSGITVTCADTRSQHRNRVLALARLRERLRVRARRRKPRRPTRVPAGVRNRNLDAKKRHGTKKTLRRKPKSEEE